MNRILACIDASTYATSVVDLAAWAATRLGADVELLHVVQRKDAVASRNDHSGAIGLGVKSELLEELTRIEEAAGRLAIEEGRILLDAGGTRLKEQGITVASMHLHGGIVETIVEREADAALVIIGKRGASGEFATDHIGSKVERVVRASDKPVLIASREAKAPDAVVIAFDNSPPPAALSVMSLPRRCSVVCQYTLSWRGRMMANTATSSAQRQQRCPPVPKPSCVTARSMR
ncbi:universal stress protein [Rhizorhabdus dicambivorans]|uniref:universal stress protein n=1 Tax=Rhizorhabdus dicambivorans TaxID=1850238 RepID=UPI001EE15096|nr:universal stress protein [Rhizorhabdus dicambivorans]